MLADDHIFSFHLLLPEFFPQESWLIFCWSEPTQVYLSLVLIQNTPEEHKIHSERTVHTFRFNSNIMTSLPFNIFHLYSRTLLRDLPNCQHPLMLRSYPRFCSLAPEPDDCTISPSSFPKYASSQAFLVYFIEK